MNIMQMIPQFSDWARNFNGDPQKIMMDAVQSGKLTQGELNNLQKQATEFQNMLIKMGIKL